MYEKFQDEHHRAAGHGGLEKVRSSQAASTPTTSAAAPEIWLWVASRMAGKVITARVT